MKKTIITTLAILGLAVPLAWGAVGGCEDGNCADARPPQAEEQSLTGSAPEVAPSRGVARDANLSDFITTGRSVEKDCETSDGATCHRPPLQPQPEPRSPEKKCGENCN